MIFFIWRPSLKVLRVRVQSCADPPLSCPALDGGLLGSACRPPVHTWRSWGHSEALGITFKASSLRHISKHFEQLFPRPHQSCHFQLAAYEKKIGCSIDFSKLVSDKDWNLIKCWEDYHGVAPPITIDAEILNKMKCRPWTRVYLSAIHTSVWGNLFNVIKYIRSLIV